MKLFLTTAAALALAAGLFAQGNGNGNGQGNSNDLAPTGKGIGTTIAPGLTGNHPGPDRVNNGSKTAPGTTIPQNGIYYHGGPVIHGGTYIYFIWYGNWSGNTAMTILPNLANSIGGSPYFNINTTYLDTTGAVTNAVTFGGQASVAESTYGTSLSDSSIQSIVAYALSHALLPYNPNGVYFVLTSKDVNETSGFCTQYCGWHTYGTINGSNVKYAFVGNPDRCPSACEEQSASSPNGNPGADGMASIISHELEEATTDPMLNAWYDRRGYENADKCAWTFGATQRASNGSLYNVTLGGLQYLIQQNWVNANGGYCAMSH